MKAFNYIRYFFYISWNWNIRLALFTLFHELKGERRYHLNTSGTKELAKFVIKGKYRNQAEMYQGASYFLMEKLFEHLINIGVSNSMVDFGCGKGRVMIVAAAYQFKEVIGIEFAKELWEEACKNISAAKKEFPATEFLVLHENAVSYKIEDHTQAFFFFNPFQELVMKKVIANILNSARKSPRPIYILYLNPQLKKLFLLNGFKEIFYLKKMQYVEASIFLLK